jgi:hypothetical protein
MTQSDFRKAQHLPDRAGSSMPPPLPRDYVSRHRNYQGEDDFMKGFYDNYAEPHQLDAGERLGAIIAFYFYSAIILAISFCILAVPVYFFVMGDRSGEVTAYYGACYTSRIHGSCPSGQERANGYTTFRADPERQIVVFWRQIGSPGKFSNCAVRDTQNWHCADGNKYASTDHDMIDGTFTETGFSYSDAYQIPRWQWFMLKANEELFGRKPN